MCRGLSILLRTAVPLSSESHVRIGPCFTGLVFTAFTLCGMSNTNKVFSSSTAWYTYSSLYPLEHTQWHSNNTQTKNNIPQSADTVVNTGTALYRFCEYFHFWIYFLCLHRCSLSLLLYTFTSILRSTLWNNISILPKSKTTWSYEETGVIRSLVNHRAGFMGLLVEPQMSIHWIRNWQVSQKLHFFACWCPTLSVM